MTSPMPWDGASGDFADQARPIGTVKSRTFAAMTALRAELGKAGVTLEDEWNTSTS